MEISRNVLENLMLTYVDHKKILNEYERECDESELYEYGNYNFHRGCCETAETWLRALGVSPQCNFIEERLWS